MIDLRPIHRLTLLLPLEVEETNEAILKTIDSLSAACFHAVLPMRMAQSEARVKSNPEPKPLEGLSLLSQLGLLRPVEKINRRF